MGPLRSGLRAMTFDGFGSFGRRVLRTDNASLPHLQNKVIFGRVESKNEEGFFSVDIGFKSPSVFHENELRRGIGTKLKEEPVPQVGDKMKLYVRYLQNPMGEMEVSNADRVRIERSEGAWREIKNHYINGTHVNGRVLNQVNGGYAVGIAGLVAFLPNQCVRPHRGSKEPPAGELVPFKILGLTEDIKNVILVGPMTQGSGGRDVAWVSKQSGNKSGGRGGKAGGSSSFRSGAGSGAGGTGNQSDQSSSSSKNNTTTAGGAFWKRKHREEKDAGASTWVKLSGVGNTSGKKQTAPLEKSAEDGRPMWGKNRTEGGGGRRSE